MITDSLIMKWRQEHGQMIQGWKWAQFDQTEATNVRLYAVRTLSDQAGKNFASAAEIRIMAPKKEEPQPEQVNKQFLEFLIGYAQSAKEKPEYEHVVPEVKKSVRCSACESSSGER